MMMVGEVALPATRVRPDEEAPQCAIDVLSGQGVSWTLSCVTPGKGLFCLLINDVAETKFRSTVQKGYVPLKMIYLGKMYFKKWSTT